MPCSIRPAGRVNNLCPSFTLSFERSSLPITVFDIANALANVFVQYSSCGGEKTIRHARHDIFRDVGLPAT